MAEELIVFVVVCVVGVVGMGLLLSKVGGVVGPSGVRPPKPEPPSPSRPGPHEQEDHLADLWSVLGPVSMVGAAACAVIAVVTFLPGPVALSPRVAVPIFGLALPVLVAAVAMLSSMGGKGRSALDRIERESPSAWPIALFLIVGFVVVVLSGMTGPSGEPEQHGDRYYLSYQGRLTEEITRQQFDEYENLTRRTYAGLAGAVYSLGVGLGIHARDRRLRHPSGT